MKALLSKALFKISQNSLELPPEKKIQKKILHDISQKYQYKPDLIRRSLQQYEANKKICAKKQILVLNIASLFILPPLTIFLFIKSFKKISLKKYKSINLYKGLNPTIKGQLNTHTIPLPNGFIRINDLSSIRDLLHAGFRPYFILRVLWKIASYNEIILKFTPKTIINSQEMNFESSALSQFCSQRGVKHVNVMHGEKIFILKDSFSYFHKYYVWDDHYVILHRSLKGKADEYINFNLLNSKLTLEQSGHKELNRVCYYAQVSKDLKEFKERIKNLQMFAKENQTDLVIRFHPKHQKEEELDYINNQSIKVEKSSTDIVDSILLSKYICSEFSTVLYQANLLGKKVIIDNTNEKNIQRYKNLDLLILQNPKHKRLKDTSGFF